MLKLSKNGGNNLVLDLNTLAHLALELNTIKLRIRKLIKFSSFYPANSYREQVFLFFL